MKWILVFLLAANLAHARSSNNAESVLLLNTTTNQIELSQNAQHVRSIASITKLMTAMVALNHDRDLDKKLPLSKRVSSHLPRQHYTRAQLLEAMLIKSDNAAAETLAENHPGGRVAFIEEMNRQAVEWNLSNTQFEDASGLGAGNVSTVYDIAALINIANNYWFIRDTSTKRQISLNTAHNHRQRTVNLTHTANSILELFDNIVVSKTGLTTAAGWCVSLLVTQDQQQWIIVVLGSRSKNQRLKTVQNIMQQHVMQKTLF